MKIAVPVKADLSLDQHFGNCDHYQIYTVGSNGEELKMENLEAPKSCGCKSNISETLQEMGVTMMLAGGIGDGAIHKLSTYGINVTRNCQGKTEDIVRSYLAGYLVDGGKSCNAHDGDHDHQCNH